MSMAELTMTDGGRKAETTMRLSHDTKAKLDEIKPFKSMSYDETVRYLIESHESDE